MKPLDELRDEMALEIYKECCPHMKPEEISYFVKENKSSTYKAAQKGWDACRKVMEEREKMLLDALNKITLAVGPNEKGHSPRDSAHRALCIAFDTLGEFHKRGVR